MKPCPECNSENVYQYKESVQSAGGYGPMLLPKLEPGIFSSAKFLPVVCADCGYLRFFAAPEAREKLKTSTHWQPV